MKKSIPNIISLFRIMLSFILLLTLNTEWLFLCLVLIIGLSDIADGYIARKYNWVSKSGSRLDSLSDLVFFAIILWVLYLKYEWLLTENYKWFLIIIFFKVSTAIVSRIKNGAFTFIHTIANKITGVLVFLSIMILPFAVAKNLFTVVFIVATFSAIEEFGIVLINKEIDLNQKSIFKKNCR